MTTSKARTEGAKGYEPQDKRPTVLMFQPTRFEVVEGEQLKEWEQHLREDVGLQGATLSQDAFDARTGCVSLCGTPERRDDCDQI
jgi:hypothetical protein